MLKSIFISSFPLLGLGAIIYAAMMYSSDGGLWSLAGLALMGMTISIFFSFLFIIRRPRTQAHLPVYTLFISLGFILAIIGLFKEDSGVWSVIMAVVLCVGWLIYLFWYSRFDDIRKDVILEIGNVLPELSFEDYKGNNVSTNSSQGNYTIYLFYRGNWCPLCFAQVKEIAGIYQELADQQIRTNLISPQPHDKTRALANRFNVDFEFLVDVNNKMAERLGIDVRYGIPMGFQVLGYDSDTVMPTVLITAPDGRLIFIDRSENYRVRPEPSMFMNVIEADRIKKK